MRGVLAVALAALAAVALGARQGLDWSALADPVEVRWARVVAGTLVLLVLLAAGRAVLRRLRRGRRRLPPGEETEPEGEPFPLLLRVLAVVLVALTLAAAWWLVAQVTGSVPAAGPDPAPSDPVGDPGAGAGEVSRWPVLLAVGLALVGAAAAAAYSARRPGDGEDPAGDAADPDTGDDATELAAAVQAAETGLAAHDDPRSAIVAAYTAMAASVTAGLARRGHAARASDTPTELLGRAVHAGLVGDGPAGELTALFREARFSRHPMGPAQRAAAERALRLVRDELAARAGAGERDG